ncbi:hypothetical protein AURDEDRAFT_163689 [Auricularia subglabra TFB-10046 SS5]|nr:hypothetical protein AURDEDRAFT_163689 [Auricularia subglabra TFB-10046 SS5]
MLSPANHAGRSLDKLPPELLILVLKSLDHTDLRRAAAVSRKYYDLAWRTGLFIHRYICWRNAPGYVHDCAVLHELVPHALTKGLRLSFSFVFVSYDLDTIQDVSTSPTAHELLSFITAALPIIVELDIVVSDTFVAGLTAGLLHPAPNINAFSLTVDTVNKDEKITHALPVDLFMKSARNLHCITLQNVALGNDPIPAFSRADYVDLSYENECPHAELVRHFPRMRRLGLDFISDGDAAPPLPPTDFSLDGAPLRRLILRDYEVLMPVFLTDTNLHDIPDVSYIGDTAEWIGPLCDPKNDGPISIRLTVYASDCDISISIVPDHRRWRRVCDLNNWDLSQPFPILCLAGLHKRLTYLRLDNFILVNLLECNGLALSALRELRVDLWTLGPFPTMVWPPDWLCDSDDGPFSFRERDKSAPEFHGTIYSYVDCAVLRQLTLFAMDARMSVDSKEVAYLGRALSQCMRPEHERAALELVGIKLRLPVAHALLEKTFSVVHHLEFAGEESLRGRDSGLWDEL